MLWILTIVALVASLGAFGEAQRRPLKEVSDREIFISNYINFEALILKCVASKAHSVDLGD